MRNLPFGSAAVSSFKPTITFDLAQPHCREDRVTCKRCETEMESDHFALQKPSRSSERSFLDSTDGAKIAARDQAWWPLRMSDPKVVRVIILRKIPLAGDA
jgi:hypothetical protein